MLTKKNLDEVKYSGEYSNRYKYNYHKKQKK